MYLTYKAKIVANKETREILNNLCFSATKLYNTVNFYLRKEWESQRALCDYLDSLGYPHEGVKIPLNRTELQNQIKGNHWARNMHSQSAQFVISEVINAYKSWFALRKNGHSEARPPGFRRKSSLSPVTFVQSAPFLFEKNNQNRLRFSLGRERKDGIKEITIRIIHQPLPTGVSKNADDKGGTLKNVKITYDTLTGNYYAHLVIDVPLNAVVQPLSPPKSTQLQLFPTHIVAIDLGLNNLMTATFSDGTTTIISGRELKAIRRYWQKIRAKVKPPSVTKRKPSKRCLQICRKEARQIAHRLHIISKQFVELCLEKGVTHIIFGDLNGIRKNIDYSDQSNQQLHNWNFAQLVDFLSYKALQVGIVVEKISEKYTSQTCCKCGVVKKSNRKTRGLYVCDCGNKINADRNGANNILTRYLRDPSQAQDSSGSVALPVVTLVLQRTDGGLRSKPLNEVNILSTNLYKTFRHLVGSSD